MFEFDHESGLFVPRRKLYGKEAQLQRPEWMAGTGFFGSAAPPVPSGFAALFHFDGANGSKVFTEAHGLAVASGGGAVISTAQSKFGGASLNFPTGGSINTTGNVSGSTGEYAMGCWFNWSGSGAGSNQTLVSVGGTFVLTINSSSKLDMYAAGSYGHISHPTTVTANAWHFALIERKGTRVALSLDGVVGVTATSSSTDVTTEQFCVGFYPQVGWNYLGYIDEAFFKNNGSLYNAVGFALPTTAFNA